METQTVTLTEFLLARIAEDQEEAAAAKRFAGEQNDPDPITGWRSTLDGGYVHEPPIVGVDPDRALAECEAKRRIVDYVEWEGTDSAEPDNGPGVMWIENRWNRVLQLLALPYADHPDYREEWRP